MSLHEVIRGNSTVTMMLHSYLFIASSNAGQKGLATDTTWSKILSSILSYRQIHELHNAGYRCKSHNLLVASTRVLCRVLMIPHKTSLASSLYYLPGKVMKDEQLLMCLSRNLPIPSHRALCLH
jgi:hypothetical protein